MYSVNVDEWVALGHHMVQMCGRVEKVRKISKIRNCSIKLFGQSCVLVKWDNGVVSGRFKNLIPSFSRADNTFAKFGGETDNPNGREKWWRRECGEQMNGERE